ncbi:glutaredoxin domain-containing protein [Pseudobacteriovorax antillogorgiicola]|uniref:Glutaredoxin 3 n=1 Tax=Pseudobacteriovorax antillogorgiicola TaxID=1513793 RepID=A0A1Y6CH48_9BACT|nr:glutaredoxin domain-containing protein [Pseudobacteriovorax antillogorgiicola]TCS48666.1 glutaredoxin 3 [Pseudobacteriovorax antillogorgiicola]SMF55037.1 glutaredoxin 3 [Pseudobacteriovorax antillogorgiicola]
MKDIKLYTTRYCGFCNRAKMLLSQLNLEYTDHSVDNDPDLRQEISDSVGGFPTVPMIFIDGQFIGGYTELANLHREGKLTK